MIRKFIGLTALLAVGSGAILFARPYFAVSCNAAAVRIGEMTEYVDLEAKTRVERTYKIATPTSGRVAAVRYTPGSRVEKGQPVAELVAQDLENRLAELTATVERLAASIREAEYVGVEEAEVKQSLKMVEMMRQIEAARKSQVAVRTSELQFAGTHLKRLVDAKSVYPVEEIEAAESQRDVKQAEYDRDRHDHLASADGIDVASYRAERFRNEIERKQLFAASLKFAKAEAVARLEQAQLDLTRSCMMSPVDGIVLERFVSDERVLPAGSDLLEVANLDDLEVIAEVLTQEAAHIRIGAHVEIYGPAVGNERVEGRILRIEPRAFTKISSLGVEEQRVNVIIGFNDGDARRLHHAYSLGVGFRVRTRIQVAEKSGAKLVPRFAVFRGPEDQWQVYVVRYGMASLVPVVVGMLNDDFAEITTGLDEDDMVLLAPDSSVRSGTHVKPVLMPASAIVP